MSILFRGLVVISKSSRSLRSLMNSKLQQWQIGPKRRWINVTKIFLNLFKNSSYHNTLIEFNNLEPRFRDENL